MTESILPVCWPNILKGLPLLVLKCTNHYVRWRVLFICQCNVFSTSRGISVCPRSFVLTPMYPLPYGLVLIPPRGPLVWYKCANSVVPQWRMLNAQCGLSIQKHAKPTCRYAPETSESLIHSLLNCSVVLVRKDTCMKSLCYILSYRVSFWCNCWANRSWAISQTQNSQNGKYAVITKTSGVLDEPRWIRLPPEEYTFVCGHTEFPLRQGRL